MRGDSKRQISWFQIDDAEAVARHLEKMEAKGWRVQSVDNWFWTYRRVEPAKVRYAVTFFPDASVYDPALTEKQETYADYCRAAGWELAAAYGPVQYFRSEEADPPLIETDEAVKLSAIRRTMRKTYVLSYALLLLLPLAYLPLFRLLLRSPAEYFSDGAHLAQLLIMAGITVFSIGFLLDYLIWLLRSGYSVKRGGACAKPHTRARLWGSWAMIAVCGASLAMLAVSMKPYLRGALVILLAFYGGIMLLSRALLRGLKRRGVERKRIRGALLAFAVGAGLATGLVTALLIPRLVHGEEAEETYTYESPDGAFSMTREVRRDPLPVTLEELGYAVAAEDHCTYAADISRSPIAAYGDYLQRPLNLDSDLPELSYQIYETDWRWLLEKSWEGVLEKADDWPLEELDPAPWGAEQAYKLEDISSYFLRYPGRVAVFRLNAELEPEQTETLVRALRP